MTDCAADQDAVTAPPAIVIVSACVAVFVPVSVTSTTNEKMPVTDGVPEITPVEELIDRLVGRLPDRIDQVYVP
jgi:hypothetical protein